MSETTRKSPVGRRVALGAAAGLSAALLWSAFPPAGESVNVAVALVPLLAVSRLCAPGCAARVWFAGGFLFWVATLSWMPAIIKNNGPWPLVVLGWAGLAAFCAGYFALFGWLSARVWRRFGRLGLLAEPILWAGCEWLRATLFTGFAWNFLGTAVGAIPTLAAPARLGGVYLVSALVVALNGVFATLLCRVLAQIRRERMPTGFRLTRTLETALPLGAILLAFSVARAWDSSAAVETVPMRVALVQRNAPCVFSSSQRKTDPLRVYERLLDPAVAARPDLIVFGESAMAEFGRAESSAARGAAGHFIRHLGGGGLLAGGDWRREDGKVYNAAALYTGGQAEVQLYGKQHLVPFGEYIPFDKWITPLQKLSPIGVSLWPGEAAVFTLPLREGRGTVSLSPLICFEDTDPVLARRAARLGAQAIVLITNDSWFSDSAESVQHAAQAVLRAVETGLPVIRTGNSGVTGVIAPSGRAAWLSDGAGRPLVDLPGTMVETVAVPVSPRLTPYARWGDLPLAVLFGLTAVLAWLRPVRRTAACA